MLDFFKVKTNIVYPEKIQSLQTLFILTIKVNRKIKTNTCKSQNIILMDETFCHPVHF